MSSKLTHVFTLRGHISSDSIDVGQLQSGPQRVIGALEGGDWVLVDAATNTANIDVRTHGKIANVEGVYVHYTGALKVDEAAANFLATTPDAKSTKFGDHDWWCRPFIETNVPQFKWTESTLFVYHGRCIWENSRRSIEYQIFEGLAFTAMSNLTETKIALEKSAAHHVEDTLGQGAIIEAKQAADEEHSQTLWQGVCNNRKAVA
ncbi:hypothetical protein NUU61_005939 [Penicillium alfredii]|uniref:Uncharacterized protein n=1 Tax=Penicillium alfredii TaxID=1506179 RepID=A0A9W9EZV6_9EURO|nr:uncharacterized protein NUU61_005939 [Penicillium alfredii]KAJ5091069.1 hypothetical protein NUU61_005939 [Penicillium alfredii]